MNAPLPLGRLPLSATDDSLDRELSRPWEADIEMLGRIMKAAQTPMHRRIPAPVADVRTMLAIIQEAMRGAGHDYDDSRSYLSEVIDCLPER